MKQYVVQEDTTLKKFTDETCPQASFVFRTLLKEREIKVNGKKVGTDMPVQAGDTVAYYMTKSQEMRAVYKNVYEDDNLLIADKESGVNSEALLTLLNETGEFYFIHRLDRNTAGLITFAKNPVSEEELLTAFRERTVDKEYEALVFGKPKQKHAVLTDYLVKDSENSKVSVSRTPVGEKIVTEYEVAEENGETTLLKVMLHTGKTHQIRAHLAFYDTPVVGDEKYGNETLNKKYKLTRQRLVAKKLRFHVSGMLDYLEGKEFVSSYTAKI